MADEKKVKETKNEIEENVKEFDYASLANIVEPEYLITSSGKKHVLPKFTIGMELRSFGKMRKISLLLGRQEYEGMYDVNTVLMEVFADEKNEEALDIGWELMELLIGKDRGWIEENIDIMDMFEVVILFFGKRMGKMSKIMSKIL